MSGAPPPTLPDRAVPDRAVPDRAVPDRAVPASQPLIVASCRLPLVRADGGWELGPGGLASVLRSALAGRPCRWLGWTGRPDDQAELRIDGMDLEGVPLPTAAVEGGIDGFANTTLWPLLHDGLRPSPCDDHWWAEYRLLNQRFATRIAATAPFGAVAWVHDYHLFVVPRLLREARPDLRVGFFLHTPFPSPEVFRRLPWRREVLEGLLGADMIGVQDRRSLRHLTAMLLHLGCIDDVRHPCDTAASVRSRGRTIDIQAHPVQVNAADIAQEAGRPDVVTASRAWRSALGHPDHLLVGVDRLDYTKGIDLRLRAFGRALDRRLFPGRAAFVQVVAPSRGHVEGYRDLPEVVDAVVGSIAERHGDADGGPVHLIRRSVSRPELLALFLAADTAVVTPLCDGMNVVAKEFVAARADLGGALVLSEFAGAAEELDAAYLTNPYDIEHTAMVMRRSVADLAAVRRERMGRLRHAVLRTDAVGWADHILSSLRRPADDGIRAVAPPGNAGGRLGAGPDPW